MPVSVEDARSSGNAAFAIMTDEAKSLSGLPQTAEEGIVHR